jgi:hypothetical protein
MKTPRERRLSVWEKRGGDGLRNPVTVEAVTVGIIAMGYIDALLSYFANSRIPLGCQGRGYGPPQTPLE